MTEFHQDESTVQRQFENQIDLYTVEAESHEYVVPDLVTPFLIPEITERPWKEEAPVEICEFGGGGGILLKRIHDALGARVRVVNAELVEAYGARQVSRAIEFQQASILDSGFATGSFDVVIVRNVLHHLIDDRLATTRKNQRQALSELFRIVRPGGLVLVQEQVNQYAWAADLLFYLSRTAARMKLDIPAFEVTPNTIVAYLTLSELRRLCTERVPTGDWLADRYLPRNVALRWKLTLLMSKNGDAFIAMRRPAP